MSYALAGEDEKSYRVKHPDGRVFPVAKQGLSESLHAQIRGMPKAMAEGGNVTPASPYDESGVLRPEFRTDGGAAPVGLAALGEAAHEAYTSPTNLAAERLAGPAPGATEGVPSAAPADPALAAYQRAAQAIQEQGQPGGFQTSQVQATVPMRDPTAYLAGAESRLDESQRLQASGIRGQAEAEKAGLGQQASALDANAATQQQILQQYQEHTKQLWDEHKRIQQDVANQHVDPQRVWSNKGTGQKISTIIGLILGGGNGNPALAILQREIDRDVDAQKTELGKKENLLADNLRQFGTLDAATAATRMQLQAIVEGQAKAIAARSGSQAAMAKADAMVGQTQQAAVPTYLELGRTRADFAFRSMMMSMVQGGGQQQYLPSLAPPPLGKDISNPVAYRSEVMHDAATRTMMGPGGKPFLAYSPEVAEKSRPMLQAAENVTSILGEMDKLRRGSAGVPGTNAARQYEQYRSALAEQWAMANGLTQPSEAMNKNLERVMPGSFDAFVRGKATFEPILRLIHERQKGIWQSAGLHPSAIPPLQFPAR
jgi:hypothetical protein